MTTTAAADAHRQHHQDHDGLVVLERASPGDVITVKQKHMTEGSSMYLRPGERVTVEELLYGLLLCSGNDAAAAWRTTAAERPPSSGG